MLGLFAWIGIPLIHAAWMFIDLKLRNPESIKEGGIPETLTLFFQWTSLGIFGILVFISLGNIDSPIWRVIVTLLAVGVAFALLIFGWLFYITGNGIDSL